MSFVSRFRPIQAIRSSSLLSYTLMHTAIVVLLCSSVLWVVKDLSLGYYEKKQNQFVQEQLVSLKAIADNASQADFIKAVDLLAEDSRQALVVLKSPSGFYGNLNYLPDSVPYLPVTGSFLILGDSVLGDERLQWVQGSKVATRWGDLLVAYNSSDFNLFVGRFTLAIYVAMVLSLVVGLLTGFLFSRKVLARLNEINRITSQVGQGRLEARVPVSNKGDEFDELAGQINDMLTRIEDSVEAMASVTNSIAHDLRTPLSRLRIKMDGFLRAGSASQEDLLLMQSELDTVLHTFNAMLELSKIEHGGGEITFENCDLNELVEEVVELAEPLAEERHQKLRLKVESKLQVEGNRPLLFRILFNLVENAIKYAPEHTEIQVRLNDRRIAVMDEGQGIPESEQEKVFRRLYRLDHSRSTPGHGLGLSLVKAVAELHRAEVGFERVNERFAVVLDFKGNLQE